LKRKLTATFGCPIVDWYSITETGPVGYSCPAGEGYHVLPHDIYVELVDKNGQPVRDGERGEITVSGGRNPFLAMLRYRTGDWATMDFSPCVCGDEMPRLRDLEGRAPVLLRGDGGTIINPIDISRVLREYEIVQHEMTQTKSGDIVLVIRPVPQRELPDAARITRELHAVFGLKTAITVRFDADLGSHNPGGKVLPYRSDYLLEEGG